MFPGTTGWAISLVVIFIVWIVLYVRKGPSEALAPALLLSLAFPVWLKLTVFDIPFSIRTVTAAVTMLAFAIHPRGRILSPLTLLDFCIAFLCCSQILTDAWHDGMSVSLPFLAYGEWGLPYVAGRYAIRNQQDLVTASKWAVGVMLFLSLLAVIETLTKVNVAELVFGERPEELAKRNTLRLGFKRAYVVAMHPIYFGMLLAVLSPWIVCLISSTQSKAFRTVALIAVPVTILGIVATMSRTPFVTILGGWFLLMAIIIRWLRIPIMTLIVAAVAVFAIWPYQVTDFIEKYTAGDRQRLIEMNGSAVVYSASRARLLLPFAYAKAMSNAGLVGYGSAATKTFPLEIPYLEGTAETKNSLKLVDNGYVLTVLRMGWLGGFLMLLLFVTGMFSSWLLYLKRPDRIFPAAFLGMLIVYSFVSLNLVSQIYDFFLPMLWSLGVISGLSIQKSGSYQGPEFSRSLSTPHRR